MRAIDHAPRKNFLIAVATSSGNSSCTANFATLRGNSVEDGNIRAIESGGAPAWKTGHCGPALALGENELRLAVVVDVIF